MAHRAEKDEQRGEEEERVEQRVENREDDHDANLREDFELA